jgi:hypothetical protein
VPQALIARAEFEVLYDLLGDGFLLVVGVMAILFVRSILDGSFLRTWRVGGAEPGKIHFNFN